LELEFELEFDELLELEFDELFLAICTTVSAGLACAVSGLPTRASAAVRPRPTRAAPASVLAVINFFMTFSC
jgi:hypothetical protein